MKSEFSIFCLRIYFRHNVTKSRLRFWKYHVFSIVVFPYNSSVFLGFKLPVFSDISHDILCSLYIDADLLRTIECDYKSMLSNKFASPIYLCDCFLSGVTSVEVCSWFRNSSHNSNISLWSDIKAGALFIYTIFSKQLYCGKT